MRLIKNYGKKFKKDLLNKIKVFDAYSEEEDVNEEEDEVEDVETKLEKLNI